MNKSNEHPCDEPFARKLFSFISLLLGLFIIVQTAYTQDVYDFESLNVNNLIQNQDNWIDQPGQGYAGIIQDSTSVNGSKVVWAVPQVVFNEPIYLTRVSDGNFSFPDITPIQTHLTIQFDCTGHHIAMFALGHDRNGDGMLKKSEGEIGPAFGTWDRNFMVQGANLGTAYQAGFNDNGLGGNSGKDWFRIQLRIDFTANLGEGAGSIYYKNLTDGDPQFTAVPNMQHLNLELSSLHPDAVPIKWDAMWLYLMSGGGNDPTVDNLNPVAEAEFCQLDIGYGGPGNAKLSLCGGDLSSGTTADLLLTGAPAGKPALLMMGTQFNPTPFAGGMVVPVPFPFAVLFAIDLKGDVFIPGIPGGGGPATFFMQFIYEDPVQSSGLGISNGLQVEILP